MPNLKKIIQARIDTNLALSLTEFSGELKVNPFYTSREFSKYFEDISLCEYIRKMRVEKAIQLLHSSKYSLTGITLLTDFTTKAILSEFSRKTLAKILHFTDKNYLKSKAYTTRQIAFYFLIFTPNSFV